MEHCYGEEPEIENWETWMYIGFFISIMLLLIFGPMIEASL